MSKMIGVCGEFASSVYEDETRCLKCPAFKSIDEINQSKDVQEKDIELREI